MKKFNKLLYVVSSVAFISIINKIIFTLAKLKNVLHTNNSYYYQWKFGKTFYTVQGSGKPILLIHSMYTGSSNYEYHKLIKKLSKKYKVYAIDLIGFGLSDKPRITYTSYLYVQLITDFVKDVIKKPTHIIASSKSTSFSIIACYQNPELFDKLLLIDPQSINSLAKNPSNLDHVLRYILEFPVIGTLIYNIVSSKNNIKALFSKKFFFNRKKIKNKYIQAFHEAAHLSGTSSKFVYASNQCNYMSVNIRQAIENINNSMMLIIGNDVDYKNDILNDYTHFNSSIETISILESKHMPHLEKPDSIMNICDIYF